MVETFWHRNLFLGPNILLKGKEKDSVLREKANVLYEENLSFPP